jgi:chemotaxis signal transduction protein
MPSASAIKQIAAASADRRGSGVVQGVINLSGQVVPVCDLSSRLGEMLDIHDDSRILNSDNGLGNQLAKVQDRLIILLDAERNLTGLLIGDC